MKHILSSPILCIILFSCGTHPAKKELQTEDQKLTSIIESYTEKSKRLDAFQAPYFNIEEDLKVFGDYPSPDFYDRSKKTILHSIEELNKIHPDLLSPENQISYALFKEDLEAGLESFQFPNELDFNQMGNRMQDYMDSSSLELTQFPFDTVKHYEDFLARANGFPNYINEQITLLKSGIKKKITLNCTIAKLVPHSYQDALVSHIEKNPFFRPVTQFPKDFSASDKKRLTEAFKKMITEIILPNYKKFHHFYTREYLKNCHNGFGLNSYPNGKKWYQFEIKSNTNLDLTPDEIHQTGLKEVSRISAELEKIKNEDHFRGSLRSYLIHKSKDQNSYFKSKDDLMNAFQTVKEKTAAKVKDYFLLVPKSDFKIVETSNPEDAAGSYNQPTESAPFGRFVVNAKNLKSVMISEVTTLMLHETVPGHHFQQALQFEMKNLSEYQRKIYNSTSFVEGWALYSEYLGNEMGMYTDPEQRFGNLNDEMLRAVRLVVDTGIHAYGWSQKKALRYSMEHLATDKKGMEVEINRYSAWPAQALAYKIGELKILGLRKKAESILKEKFNIKGFHEAVIGHGTISLPVLESKVNEWIQNEQKK